MDVETINQIWGLGYAMAIYLALTLAALYTFYPGKELVKDDE